VFLDFHLSKNNQHFTPDDPTLLPAVILLLIRQHAAKAKVVVNIIECSSLQPSEDRALLLTAMNLAPWNLY
jgi:hypothetical protein